MEFVLYEVQVTKNKKFPPINKKFKQLYVSLSPILKTSTWVSIAYFVHVKHMQIEKGIVVQIFR